VRIKTCSIDKIEPSIHKQFVRLHLRDGIILDTYMHMKNNEIGRIVYAIENNTVLGWSILEPHARTYHAMIYVRKSARKMGVANKIMRKINQIGEKSNKKIIFQWSEYHHVIKHFTERYQYIKLQD